MFMHTFVVVVVISPTTRMHTFVIVDVAIPTTLGSLSVSDISISVSDNSISAIGSKVRVSEMNIKICDIIFMTKRINTVFAQ